MICEFRMSHSSDSIHHYLLKEEPDATRTQIKSPVVLKVVMVFTASLWNISSSPSHFTWWCTIPRAGDHRVFLTNSCTNVASGNLLWMLAMHAAVIAGWAGGLRPA